MTETDRARLVALATVEARAQHNRNSDDDGWGACRGHLYQFEKCPYVDCVLVREAATPAPVVPVVPRYRSQEEEKKEDTRVAPLSSASTAGIYRREDNKPK